MKRPEIRVDLPTRFWIKVNKDGPIHADLGTPCWLWAGAVSSGYGTIRSTGKIRKAHRVSYELTVGAIPPGLDLDHLCRVPLCVNPAHLEPVTRLVNVQRGMAPSTVIARTKRCKRGHDLLVVGMPTKQWGIRCRTCSREHWKKWSAANKARKAVWARERRSRKAEATRCESIVRELSK